MSPRPVLTPATTSQTETVPEGRIRDFLTGRLFNDTPEEYVRQNIERALVREYRYEPSLCAPEFPIRVGSSRKRVDVAVFAEGVPQAQDSIKIIVEAKRAGTSPAHRTEGVEQLKSYLAACVNAEYGIWTNGDERISLAKRSTGDGYVFEEIIDIPAAGQTEEDAQRPDRKDLKPATADNLLFAFRRCHNYISSTEGKHKPDAFWELLKLIFTKIEDERSPRIEFYVTPTERTSATNAGSAKNRIERVFAQKVVRKYPYIFPEGDRTIDLTPSVVAYVVSQLQGYSLLRSPVDVKGVAYEEIVGSNLRGDRGEFFTPRNACRMAVSMLDPQPGERVLDPACGTGGFLVIAMNHVLAKIEQEQRSRWADPGRGSNEEYAELHAARDEFLSSCVFGLDLNPALVRAAKMNMVMNNDGSGHLYQANSLANPHRWRSEAAAAVTMGSMDVIVTNPPFGANITIDDEEVLRQYDLAARWDLVDGRWVIRRDRHGVPVLQRSQPPEILFIERCVQLLRPGTGRMAMVIPNGILNNPATAHVRQWLYENTQILAVVDMARELFQPRNDTQTSMVLVRRLSPEERSAAADASLDYPVFMAVAETVGQDKRGNVIYRRDDVGDDVLLEQRELVRVIDEETGQEVEREVTSFERVIDDELPDVAQSYQRWLREVAG